MAHVATGLPAQTVTSTVNVGHILRVIGQVARTVADHSGVAGRERIVQTTGTSFPVDHNDVVVMLLLYIETRSSSDSALLSVLNRKTDETYWHEVIQDGYEQDQTEVYIHSQTGWHPSVPASLGKMGPYGLHPAVLDYPSSHGSGSWLPCWSQTHLYKEKIREKRHSVCWFSVNCVWCCMARG